MCARTGTGRAGWVWGSRGPKIRVGVWGRGDYTERSLVLGLCHVSSWGWNSRVFIFQLALVKIIVKRLRLYYVSSPVPWVVLNESLWTYIQIPIFMRLKFVWRKGKAKNWWLCWCSSCENKKFSEFQCGSLEESCCCCHGLDNDFAMVGGYLLYSAYEWAVENISPLLWSATFLQQVVDRSVHGEWGGVCFWFKTWQGLACNVRMCNATLLEKLAKSSPTFK